MVLGSGIGESAGSWRAAFGAVYDQDTDNLRAQQQGVKAARKAGETLGNYQEVRIRHFNRTIDKYLKR